MSRPVPRGVAGPIAGLFGSAKLSDCEILFCGEAQEEPTKGEEEEEKDEEGHPRKRARLASAAASAEPLADVLYGEPLPGHLFVLRLASERFSAQIERWDSSAGDRAEQKDASSSSSAASRPQLRVPLGSEAEVPFARAAIGYAYTGAVAAEGVRAALEVRRQAAYLQINGCTAACDELLLGMLAGRSSRDGNAAGGGGGRAAAGSGRGGCEMGAGRGGRPQQGRALPEALTGGRGRVGPAAAAPAADTASSSSAVIELIRCWALLPDPVEEPTFAPVLAAANKALVRHFGDALAALNAPSLRQQLLQLPAACVEALLGSESFGTDSEDSVLLLLATWMKANHGQTDTATRERLCRLVRLVQLGRPYLTVVLPALAADHELVAGGSPRAWFPISVTEAAFVANLATAAVGAERNRYREFGKEIYDVEAPCYNAAARPQCLPGAGRTNEWAIGEQDLREALGRVLPDGYATIEGSFAGGNLLCARGLEWTPSLEVTPAATSAGLFLGCSIPIAYAVRGSRLGGGNEAVTVMGLDARLEAHGWRDGARREAFVRTFKAANFSFALGCGLESRSRGWSAALPLAQPPQQLAGDNSGDDALAGWADYLHGGRLTGTLTLLPPPP